MLQETGRSCPEDWEWPRELLPSDCCDHMTKSTTTIVLLVVCLSRGWLSAALQVPVLWLKWGLQSSGSASLLPLTSTRFTSCLLVNVHVPVPKHVFCMRRPSALSQTPGVSGALLKTWLCFLFFFLFLIDLDSLALNFRAGGWNFEKWILLVSHFLCLVIH